MSHSSKIKVALDVDDTAADIITPWIKAYNQLQHTKHKVQNLVSWDFAPHGLDNDIMMQLYPKLWNHQSHLIKSLINLQTLEKVYLTYHISFVTSRDQDTVEGAKIWFKNHNLDHFTLVCTKTPKELLDYDIYIDDAPHLREALLRHPKKQLLLVDHPWNRDLSPRTLDQQYQNIRRVKMPTLL